MQTPHGISDIIPQPISQQSDFIHNKNVLLHRNRSIPPATDQQTRLLHNRGYVANIGSTQTPKTFPLVKQVECIVRVICH